MTSNTKAAPFFPNLDGLRLFCFIAVFFFHSFSTRYDDISGHSLYRLVKYGLFGNGDLGVNFFFVLSGFLISFLLLHEKETSGWIHIGKFYMRRILRIWPLFYACVFFGFIIFPWVKTALGQIAIETATPVYYLFFLNNLEFVSKGLPDCSVLGVLWSVAIEEQFYLLWPVLFLLPRTYLPWIFAMLLLVSIYFRTVNMQVPRYVTNHTASCISDLTVGGVGAYGAFYSDRFKRWVSNWSHNAIVLLYLSVAAIFFFRSYIFSSSEVLNANHRVIISVVFLAVILEQNYCVNSIFKMSNFSFPTFWGKYTYGLYCLHMVAILIVANGLNLLHLNTTVFQVLVMEGFLSLLLSFILAYFSFHWYEKPFLNLKAKFSFRKQALKEQAVSV